MLNRPRSPGALFLALALAAAPAFASTTTTSVTLSTTAYTDLGAGPMYLGAVGGNVQYQVADSQPSSNTPALGSVNAGQSAANLQVTSHVWARGSSVLTSAIVGSGTGVTGWGGTGGSGGGGGSVTQGTSPWVETLAGSLLPAFASTPTVNLGTLGAAGTAANQASILAAVQANAPIIASTGGSGTVTTGGTAQNLFSGATPTNGFEVCNPSATAELWVTDLTTAAANASGSYRVGPNGGCYQTPNAAKPAGPVSVYGATTGQPITARKW